MIVDELLWRFGIHAVFIFVLVRTLYYRKQRKRDFAFALLMFSFVVFLLTFFLKDVEISLGFTFGLFAIFAMLQYRTDTISPKEMTYLLIAVGSALINAVSLLEPLYLSVLNLALLTLTWFSHSRLFLAEEFRQSIDYEKIDLIHPERHAELLADLRTRTGLDIYRVELRHIDLVRDISSLRVYYRPQSGRGMESE